MEDYYKILGVRNTASLQEIRRAYRVLARRYHPDVNPGAKSEDLFKVISEAYAVLSDSEQRTVYDKVQIAKKSNSSNFNSASSTENTSQKFNSKQHVYNTYSSVAGDPYPFGSKHQYNDKNYFDSQR